MHRFFCIAEPQNEREDAAKNQPQIAYTGSDKIPEQRYRHPSASGLNLIVTTVAAANLPPEVAVRILPSCLPQKLELFLRGYA